MRRKDDNHQQLADAKRSYAAALEEKNHQEEARWANLIGHIHKNRGEYVEALRWLRRDYEASIRHLPEKQLLATCQSLGEIYLRLHQYEDALTYQKKHVELAKNEDDLIEQQRACTQLGRTYHEMFLRSDDDHLSVRNAKKYFKSAMKLAQTIKENPPSDKVSFIKEYIDAHNNLGMLEIDLDNLEEAEKILTIGLNICDEEEVAASDDTRSRLHHNLGNVYLELRRWEKAHEHIKKDIIICKSIGHCQGEAKGYINLGELHYRNQKYDEAILSYQKALELAKTLEDEDALVDQINQNIETVREAMIVMDGLKKEEQNLKKFERKTETARGMENERQCLLKQNTSLDCLIEKSRAISAWIKLRQYGKKKKRIASELCDKEKLSDSFLVIAESYQQLRKFSKAIKWYRKGWETFMSLGNFEGQALAKINIGDVLDASGDWTGALDAFKEGYGIAVSGKLHSLQLSALENMHYSHMIRFDDTEEARKTKLLINELKQSKNGELEAESFSEDCCSETRTGLDNLSADDHSDGSFSPKTNNMNLKESKSNRIDDELNDDILLISLRQSKKKLAKHKAAPKSPPNVLPKSLGSPVQGISGSSGILMAKKRVRVILSDDEDDDQNSCPKRVAQNSTADEGTASSNEFTKFASSCADRAQDVSPVSSPGAFSPVNLEKSIGSYKSNNSKLSNQDAKHIRFTGPQDAELVPVTQINYSGICADSCSIFHNESSTAEGRTCCSEACNHIIFKFDQDLVRVHLDSHDADSKLCMEQLKVELACLYYLQLSREKRSQGFVPVVQHIKYCGNILESVKALYGVREQASQNGWIDVSIGDMVPKYLMKLYIDCCEEASEPPNMKVVRKLYNLEVSEDEIIVSDCQLRDVSVAPLLNALQLHKALAVLDLSHNVLGNGTVEKLKQMFTSSRQTYGGLVLNLHSNRLGPVSLFQICECPALYARLEVLNLSENNLTDACASYLRAILQNCKALYTLDLENCSITSRTVQMIADSLDSGSVLTHLFIGHNHPVSGNAVINLLLKLGTLSRFQELSLRGIKLSKPVVDRLCQLSEKCCLSGLLLGNTNIGTEAATQLIKPLSKDTQELVRLDLSFCGLTCDYIARLCSEVSLISGILELNLGGNSIMEKCCNELVSFLQSPQCSLRVLVLCKCELGLAGITRILQALSSDSSSLEELLLAENVSPNETLALTESLILLEKGLQTSVEENSTLFNEHEPEGVEAKQETTRSNETTLEVADSEDEHELDPTCSSQKRADFQECTLIQDLSSSIKTAKNLKILDISCNGLSKEVVEVLFSAWGSSDRGGVVRRHVKESTVHFSLQENKCCDLKPCCRRI